MLLLLLAKKVKFTGEVSSEVKAKKKVKVKVKAG